MRLKIDDVDTQPPLHSTHICICTECRRVANAHVIDASSVAFNELGNITLRSSNPGPCSAHTRTFRPLPIPLLQR